MKNIKVCLNSKLVVLSAAIAMSFASLCFAEYSEFSREELAKPAKVGVELSTLVRLNNTHTSARVEYTPAFPTPHPIGVIGIGGQISSADTTGNARLKNMSGFGFGGYLRYQFKYFKDQPLVPYGGYLLERRSYVPYTRDMTWSNLRAPFVGMEFLLNPLDMAGARSLYESVGIRRSYLFGELRHNYRHTSNVEMRNYVIFMGVRVEI
jgi:hypothetical protein